MVVNYASSKSGADKVVEAITSKGGKAIAVKADVSKAEDAKALIDDTLKAFGRLDVLVNNSGVYEFAPLEAITEESFHRLFNTNVLGLLLVTQAAAKHLPEGGSVINIGSGVTRITPPNSAVYTATKGAGRVERDSRTACGAGGVGWTRLERACRQGELGGSGALEGWGQGGGGFGSATLVKRLKMYRRCLSGGSGHWFLRRWQQLATPARETRRC
ncbi:MAG TPA: SDR family NAD(P)-dependent oxidoreductase [Polyangiaceae bacterium]